MNVLFLSNWSIGEGITRSTIFPIMSSFEKDKRIAKVILCTVEKDDVAPTSDFGDKVIYVPLNNAGRSTLSKIMLLIKVTRVLPRVIKKYKVDFLWCRGAPAGGFGTLVNLLAKVPFVVDSFEPHAQYMISSGTWRKSSPKFWIQYCLEYLVRKKALALLPVSYSYYEFLLAQKISKSRLFVFPCVVNIVNFSFNNKDRERVRLLLGISNDMVAGIYIGKFGGLYLDREAFRLYNDAFDFWGKDFFLIILTEMDRTVILSRIKEFSIPIDRVYVAKVDHSEVAAYLSAADFAFSTIKPAPALQYCSPIKHGEYWAADLPILSTLTVGDDANILQNEGGGYIYNIFQDKVEIKLRAMNQLIRAGRTGNNAEIASKYRNSDFIRKAIDFVLEKIRLQKSKQAIN